MIYRLLIGSLAMFALGCAAAPKENLPAYAFTDDQSAVAALCQRAASVKTFSSECSIAFTDQNGDEVELNGAIVMQPPDSLRLRAWKFDQAVFDLTLIPSGLWIEVAKNPGSGDGSGGPAAPPPDLDAAKTAKAMSLLGGDFFCAGGARVYDNGGPIFRVERTIDGQRVACMIDRDTLTPRQYSLYDASGVERFTLKIGRYQIINGVVWPVSFTAKSEKGLIQIDLKDPEINGELNPNAFVPPKQATKAAVQASVQ